MTAALEDLDYLASPEELIEEARQGRMVVLVDEEDRENEGDLIIPADRADADAINFMAKYGRGLICLALSSDRVDALDLPLMSTKNASRLQTAFTVSIEAREGITTGISAADRARTVAVAIDPTSGPQDLAVPGHVFPLRAREGGILVRAGHTEAAVDIARLAGSNPSAVICEVMSDDGSMARLPELMAFCQLHGLKIGTIRDLIAYRRRTETLVERHLESDFESEFGGDWKLVVYVNKVSYAEHIALVKGNVSEGGPVPVRMHALNVLEDVLGKATSGHGRALTRAMDQIGDLGRGVVVLIREARRDSLSQQLKMATTPADDTEGGHELRDYGVGAQILLDLGISEMVLMTNNPKPVIGLDGYGLKIVETMPLGRANQ
ncbi:MAG: 3,4-dihydroxy-2-butanone-4-phosphate synthase [Pseudomonadota bacterium]